MRFTCTAGQLRSAVAAARRALTTNPPQAAYSGVNIDVKGSKARISGSDGDLTITTTIKGRGNDDGTALFAPKPVAEYVDHLPADTEIVVALSDTGDLCITPAGGTEYRFRTLGIHYPQPNLSKSGMVPVDPDAFAAAVDAAAHAADEDAHVTADSTGFRIDATDHYRLCTVTSGTVSTDSPDAVLAYSALREIARIRPTEIVIDRRAREVRARSDHATIAARVTERSYPDVPAVTSRWSGPTGDVDRAELRSALARLAAVSAGEPLDVLVEQQTMTLACQNRDTGHGSETVQLSGPAPEFSCRIAVRYLSDAAAATRGARVEIAWSAPTQPLFLHSSDLVDVLCVVMPINV